MNYIEHVLERSGELWRAQENVLSDNAAPARMAFSAIEEIAENDAAERPRQSERSGLSDETQEKILTEQTPENYRRRLTEKLLSDADEQVLFQKTSEERTIPLRRAERADASSSGVQIDTLTSRGEESGVHYLVQALQNGGISGLAGEREPGRTVVSEIVREGLDAQTLSRGLERDARRYDGGFSLY